MAKLNEIIDNAVEKSSSDLANKIAADKVTGTLAPNPMQARTAPAQDVYDQDYSIISQVARFSPGRLRPMWDQPQVAITHTPVSSLLNSGQSQNTQSAQIIGGVVGGVVAPASGFAPVPNMQVVIKASGPVHLVASLTVQSTQATDNISFAFYRGSGLISQIFTHSTTTTANNPSLVSFSMIDSDVDGHSPLATQSYFLYWKAGTGTLSTIGSQRSFYAVNLFPQ